MDFLWNKLTEWLKEMLVGGVMGNLTGLFDSINGQVAQIAGTVGTTPQGWNGGVFGMVQSLSQTVIVPIAGIILALVMTMELIQMIVDRNNMHDFDTFMIYKWVCLYHLHGDAESGNPVPRAGVHHEPPEDGADKAIPPRWTSTGRNTGAIWTRLRG